MAGQLADAVGKDVDFESRIIADGKAETAVEHVGVGEVFVIAGQSNSSNHGGDKQAKKTGKVAAFDRKRWHTANDPTARRDRRR